MVRDGEIMKTYKSLNVWKKAHELVLQIYALTDGFPKLESFGLTSQLRRAAASVPTNIAEGSGAISQKAFIRYLHFALSSAKETEYLLLLCRDLSYLDRNRYTQLSGTIIEIQKMLAGLIRNHRT